jgi:hypothetical protein
MGIFDWLKKKKEEWKREKKIKEWKKKEEERKNIGTYGSKSKRDDKKVKGEKDTETLYVGGKKWKVNKVEDFDFSLTNSIEEYEKKLKKKGREEEKRREEKEKRGKENMEKLRKNWNKK